MAKKVFTDESLSVLIDEIKAYINEVVESAILEAKNNGSLFTDEDRAALVQDVLAAMPTHDGSENEI